MVDAEQFYDGFADEYDAMTQFITRLGQQEALLSALLKRYPARRAIDMGCGTGVHTIALDRLGITVTGVDVSGEMLAHARRHAASLDAAPRFVHGDFLSTQVEHCTDLIFCLGNSLPHLASLDELTAVLKHWRSLLADKGQVIIQILNYDHVLQEKERIVNIRRIGKRTIVRFYDFLDHGLRFNILTIVEENGSPSHALRSTRLSPFSHDDIKQCALAAGYSAIDLFSDLKFTPFTSDAGNCIAVLR